MNLPEPILNSAMGDDGDGDDDVNGINPDYQDDIVAYSARICEGGLFSADLVSNPSCNPSLFSQVMPDQTPTEEVPVIAPVEEVKVEEVTPLVETLEAPDETAAEVVSEAAPEESEESTTEIEPVSPEESLVSKEQLEVVAEEIPAPAELSRKWSAISTDLEASRTELSAIRSELSAVKSELTAAQTELSKRDAELVDLRYLHRSVLAVMGLSASVEIPEIAASESDLSVIERYEAMPAGSDRLSFFQANRREIESALTARVGK